MKDKYEVIRTAYHNLEKVENISLGIYDNYDDADCVVHDCVDEFMEYHDNDERIDWNIVEIYDDIGNTERYVWDIEKK